MTIPRAASAEHPAPTSGDGYTFAPDDGTLISGPSSVPEGGFPSPGPDVIVGVVSNTTQYGRTGAIGVGTVGLSHRTESCNKGDAPYHWFPLPNVDHPMIAMNLYRLRPINGSQRFEQIGYSWIKHAFSVFEGNACGFGCQSTGTTTMLGVGCSDPYSSSLNGGQCGLGPRSAVNPYTGVIPGGVGLGGSPCASLNHPARDHRGHVHDGISHRVQVRDVDLMPELNPGARYFSEAVYVGPHEFTDPDAFANQNMHNNASYREVTVTGPDFVGRFTFGEVGSTINEEPAIAAWGTATLHTIESVPGVDGRAFLASKSVSIGGGQWHHEFVIFNFNLDRSIGSLSVPLPPGATASDIGFYAPAHHAPELHASTYSDDPWTVDLSGGAVTWSTEDFTINPDANAIRWGTAYNFRFDTNVPPVETTVTVGMFKTGETVEVILPFIPPNCLGPEDCDDGTPCNGDEECLDGDCQKAALVDCNENGEPDLCEIEAGTADDINANGIPDQCEQLGDFDDDGDVDLIDYEQFLVCVDLFGGGEPMRCAVFDFNSNDAIDLTDFGVFQRLFTGAPQCPLITGAGTNPGPGSGDIVPVTVDFPGASGSVVIHPCLPIFGCIEITINAGTKGLLNFACGDQIDFGNVLFNDGVGGPPNDAGEVTFDRGIDFACGQPFNVVFSLPCNIAVSAP